MKTTTATTAEIAPAAKKKYSRATAKAEIDRLHQDIAALEKKRDTIKHDIELLRQGRQEERDKCNAEATKHVAVMREMKEQQLAVEKLVQQIAKEYNDYHGEIPSQVRMLRMLDALEQARASGAIGAEHTLIVKEVLLPLVHNTWLRKVLGKLMRMSKCEARGSHRMSECYGWCLDCGAKVEEIARARCIISGDEAMGRIIAASTPPVPVVARRGSEGFVRRGL